MLDRPIEIDCKRVELLIRERERAITEVDAATAKADANAKFVVEEAKLETEKKYIALLERQRGSSARRSGLSQISRSRTAETRKFSKAQGATLIDRETRNLVTAISFH